MRIRKTTDGWVGCFLLGAVLCILGCSPSQTYTSDASDKHEVQIKLVVSGTTATLTCVTSDSKLLANASAFAINRQSHQGLNNMLFGKTKTTFKSLPKGEYDVWVSSMDFGGGQAGSKQISGKVPFTIR